MRQALGGRRMGRARGTWVAIAMVLAAAMSVGCRSHGDRESVIGWPLIAVDDPREPRLPNAAGPYLEPLPGTSDGPDRTLIYNEPGPRIDPRTGGADPMLSPARRVGAIWPLDRYFDLDPIDTELRVDAAGGLIRAKVEGRGDRFELAINPLFYYLDDPAEGHQKVQALWPIVQYERTREQERFQLLPILYYNRLQRADGTEDLDAFLLPLIFFGKDSTPADRSGLNRLFWRDRNGDEVLADDELAGLPAEDVTRWDRNNDGAITKAEAEEDPALVVPARDSSYFAAFPFGGTLQGILYPEIEFYLFPLYYHHVTDSGFRSWYAPWPIIQYGEGPLRESLQVMPLFARDITYFPKTEGPHNLADPTDPSPRRGAVRNERYSIFWPIVQWQNQWAILNTSDDPTDPVFERVQTFHSEMVFPIWQQQRTLTRQTTSVLWPLFGVEESVGEAEPYFRIDAPWPIFRYAEGNGIYELRLWPLYHEIRNVDPEARTERYALNLLWPLFWYDRELSAYQTRESLSVVPLFFWDRTEYRSEVDGLPTGSSEMVKVWPLFGYRRDRDGGERMEVLSPLPPLGLDHIPDLEENWAALWRLFYWERSGDGRYEEWNALGPLLRYERTPTGEAFDFFPLFQYRRGMTTGPYSRPTESYDFLYGVVGWGIDEIGAYLRLLWFIKIRLDERYRALQNPNPGATNDSNVANQETQQ